MEPHLYERAEAYLKGKLTPSEEKAFEAELATSTDLQECLHVLRLEVEAAELMIENDLREKMQQWLDDDQNESSGTVRPKSWIWVLAVAAIAAILILFIWLPDSRQLAIDPEETLAKKQDSVPPSDPEQLLVETPEETPSPTPTPKNPTKRKGEEIAWNNYTFPTDLELLMRSVPTRDTSSVLSAGIEAWRAGDYPLALTRFEQIDSVGNPEAYARAREWRAHLYFQMKQYEKAARLFGQMRQAAITPVKQDEADWYRLLSLLPDYDRQAPTIQNLLNSIRNTPGHAYAREASTLKLP